MSYPTLHELGLLGKVADELREVFSERGHHVDVAMAADPAFGSGWARSAVTRDLVVAAASLAASHVGLDFRPINGSGREFRYLESIDRRYRLRKAKLSQSGDLVVATSSDSALAVPDEALFRVEQWVFAWTLAPDGLMGEVFAAEILGYSPGSPGRLKLGRPIRLGTGDLPRGGFRPTDESLPGFDTNEEGDEAAGPAAS